MNQDSFIFKNQLITAFFCSLLAITTAIISAPAQNTPPVFEIPQFTPLTRSYTLAIIIPAYNEEARIEATLHAYFDYFSKQKNVTTTFLVVCNNCSDATAEICKRIKKTHPELDYINLRPGGKGFAVKQGFLKALDYKVDLIGFVDADMATTPPYFYELITKLDSHDGAIASRYKKDARVWPNRPFIKEMGGKFYNWVLRHNFHLDVRDTQCGAKLFRYETVQHIAPCMKETGWAFDLELLYLCQIFGKNIIEVPTTWTDMPGSHLTISGCYKEFVSAPVRIKKQQKELVTKIKDEKLKKKREAHKKEKEERKGKKKYPKRFA